MLKKIKNLIITYYLYIFWGISFSGMMGSLYFSEIEHLQPCTFCWWQRIFLYPIVIISLLAMLYKDNKAYIYVFVLSLIGFLIAIYHYLLQKTNWITESASCSLNNPCSDIQVEFFGFITLPFLSAVAFLTISLVSGIVAYSQFYEKDSVTVS